MSAKDLSTIEMLRHNKIDVALHHLGGSGQSQPLLMLHGLGECTVPVVPPWDAWPGPICGLDFVGHGASTVPAGGGYSAEVLMSDVDVALQHIGPATLAGRGLGAYVALLVAGARPDLVRGAVLADGPGLAGGGPGPGNASWFMPGPHDGSAPDPFALHELAHDIRPPDYATGFLHLLMAASSLASPLVVAAKNRPPWLAAVAAEPGIAIASEAEAVALLAQEL